MHQFSAERVEGKTITSRLELIVIVIVNNDVYGAVIVALPLREFIRFI